MSTSGLARLLQFLSVLQDSSVEYKVDHQTPDGILVTAAFPGKRLEVEFFEDELQYSVFVGDEAVESDEQALYALVKKWSA
ncbi:MAG: hypothetical protein ABL901_18480 [Hyphomicrobiaceae bacterium]